jgi:hypothetical protein
MLPPLQRLKIDLMTDGLVVSAAAAAALCHDGDDRPLTLADYASTSGIALELVPDIWVNAPLAEHNPNFVRTPHHVLDYLDGRFYVLSGGTQYPANPLPVPAYHDQLNPQGEPYTYYGITHTDRVRISPIAGCSFDCRFCDLGYKFRYHTKPAERLIEATVRALDDPVLPAKHMLISGGTPRPEDTSYLTDVYCQVAHAFPNLDVDVMMVPVPGLLALDDLRSWGIHGLAINMELYNEQVARDFMPRKASITRKRYLDTIEQAVNLFGPGTIRSLLMVGLEPMKDTLLGVEALARRGCEPVLSPFRPDPATPLRDLPPPTADYLEEIYLRAKEVTDQYAVKLGPRCIPCQHNTLTFPDDSGYYLRH